MRMRCPTSWNISEAPRYRERMAITTPDPDREVSMTDDTDIEVLPDQTSDDLDDWSDRREEDRETRLLEDRPPHWGD